MKTQTLSKMIKKGPGLFLIILTTIFSLYSITGCKKEETKPSEDPITPVITTTNINILSQQYCNKLEILPKVMLQFYYSKAQSDTALPVFTVVTDSLGLATVKNVEVRTYYYRYSGRMTGNCSKNFNKTAELITNKGETKLNILID